MTLLHVYTYFNQLFHELSLFLTLNIILNKINVNSMMYCSNTVSVQEFSEELTYFKSHTNIRFNLNAFIVSYVTLSYYNLLIFL